MHHITLHNDHTSSFCSWKHAHVCVYMFVLACTHIYTHIQCDSPYFLSARQFEKIMELLQRKEKYRPQVCSVITRSHENTECCRLHIIHIHTECVMTNDSRMQILLHYCSLTGLCNISL